MGRGRPSTRVAGGVGDEGVESEIDMIPKMLVMEVLEGWCGCFVESDLFTFQNVEIITKCTIICTEAGLKGGCGVFGASRRVGTW